MSLELHLELWEAMQEHIVDTKTAADDFVSVLVENGFDAKNIALESTNDDIKKALLDYSDEIDVDVDDDMDEFFDDN
jgi:hypothetical protein